MITPSMSLSSSTRRRSLAYPGLKVATFWSALSPARLANRFSSMSQSVLISTSESLAKPRLSALPWPRMPIEASTTRSFAPSTRRASPATTAAAAREVAVNRRRLISFRSLAMECLLGYDLAFYPSCMPRKRPKHPVPAPEPEAAAGSRRGARDGAPRERGARGRAAPVEAAAFAQGLRAPQPGGPDPRPDRQLRRGSDPGDRAHDGDGALRGLEERPLPRRPGRARARERARAAA